MNAIVGRHRGRSNAFARCRHCLAAPLLLFLTEAAVATEPPLQAASSTSIAQADHGMDERRGPQLELSGSFLPRFDNTDGSTHTSRLDLTWLPHRRSALGLAVGMSSPYGSSLASGPAFAGHPPGVDLGLHWRYTLDSNYRVDVTAWRRIPADAATLVQSQAPTYGARIEMGMGQATRRGFVADRGFLGFQLESGARITVRRSGGKPMIYYRTKF